MSRWVYELGSVIADTAEKATDSHERSLNTNIAQAVGLLTTNEAIQEELKKDNRKLAQEVENRIYKMRKSGM